MSAVIGPPIPADDLARAADLDALGLLLTEPESVFDVVTRELARIFDVPGAFISFIDRDTHYYKSEVGLLPQFIETRTEPRNLSICAHVVGNDDMVVVEDLLADERFRHNPVVIESGMRFYAGAPLRADSGRPVGSVCIVDVKPRTVTQRECDLLRLVGEGVMAQVRLQVASRQLLQRTTQIERDLDQARQVQRYLLPDEDIRGSGWRIRHVYRPVRHLGGDLIDVIRRPDGRHAIIMADVSGHGTSAAMTAMMAKTAFARAASAGERPADVLSAMHRDLSGLVPPGRFITAVTLLLDAEPRRLSVACAGHPPPLLVGPGGVAPIESRNDLPLLVEGQTGAGGHTPLTLGEGERLLIYTDGAIEARRREQRWLGIDGLMRIAEESMADEGDAFLASIMDRILAFAGAPLDDDVALLSVETA